MGAEYEGVEWGLSEDDDDRGLGKRYVMTDGEWHECPDDLWDVIVAGLEARNERLERS